MNKIHRAAVASRIFQAGLYFTLAFGVSMVIFPGLTLQFFGLVIFQDTDVMLNWPADIKQYVTLAHAVMGSVMIGWASLMLCIARVGLPLAGRSAMKAIGLSIMAWYLPDTLASLFHGFWQNALLNTGFLVMLMLPLYRLYAQQSNK